MNWIVTATIETAPDQPIVIASTLREARELTDGWIKRRRHVASPVLVEMHFWRQSGLTGVYEHEFSDGTVNA